LLTGGDWLTALHANGTHDASRFSASGRPFDGFDFAVGGDGAHNRAAMSGTEMESNGRFSPAQTPPKEEKCKEGH
jgi:hypothetical protein